MADLTFAQRATLTRIVKYLDVGGAGKYINQTLSDELGRIFGQTCGFACGCPGSFKDELRLQPTSTLLKVILCIGGGATVGGGTGGGIPLPGADLDTAEDYGILAGTTITNTGASVVVGDLGLSPGTSVTGFPPGLVTGTQHITDVQAAQAQLDLTAAYLDLEGRPGGISVAGNIGGSTRAPGTYKSTSTLAVSSGDLTLDAGGNPDAVFIFQIASTLTLTPGRAVILAGGAQAKNIFWQVGSSATLDTTSVFKGSILALTSITVNAGASVQGRLLARNGAVTLDSDAVVVPV